MKKYYLIDASGYIFRAYYGIPNMTNSKGMSTNALYGFIKSVQKLISDVKSENIIAVFDGKNNRKKRCEIYPKYKANRSKAPEDLPQQLEWSRQYCQLAGIPSLYSEEDEADDVIGSFVEWASTQDAEVYICSADKDLCQLVNEKTFILNTQKNNLIIDASGVTEKFGVPPEKIIDYLSIMGDSSDNIPGLSGFGPKTAAKLLEEHGSLEAILKNPEKVPGKKKQETLVKEADLALISKKLVTLDRNIPLELDKISLAIEASNNEKLKEFLEEMNFKSFLKEFEEPQKQIEEECDYILVNNEDDLDTLCHRIAEQKEVCFDTETTSLKSMQAKLIGIGFAWEEGKAYYIPFNGKLDESIILKKLKMLFSNPEISFYGHNVKYDLHVLANYEIDVASISFDTILASYLLNANLHRHSLDALSLTYFGKSKTTIEELIGKGKKQISLEEVDIDLVKNYCCEDVDYTWRLKQQLAEELKERKLYELLEKLEIPLMFVLMHMERHGIYVDRSALDEMSKVINSSIRTVQEEIHSLAGEDFSINSPKQLGEILFNKLGIPALKKTATGYSTNADVLKSLETHHPIISKVLQYRTLEKLRSTYIDSLPSDINPDTGRVHCSFNQSVAATGRLSCKNPNLQNIPIRTKLGKEIRKAFTTEDEEHFFVAADYSQIELRLLAHFSEDPDLISAFCRGDDIHSFTASKIFSIPLEEVTKEHRYQAKTVNFGILYGQQAFGLARELRIPIKEAAQFIELYFSRYPKIRLFVEECKVDAHLNGFVKTLLGRERLLPEINSKNKMVRANAERLAVNTVLQGTAADLIKEAMLSIDIELKNKKLKTKMILQIHDELLFEVPKKELEIVQELVRNKMENIFKLKIPLLVDISIGKNWKEC